MYLVVEGMWRGEMVERSTIAEKLHLLNQLINSIRLSERYLSSWIRKESKGTNKVWQKCGIVFYLSRLFSLTFIPLFSFLFFYHIICGFHLVVEGVR